MVAEIYSSDVLLTQIESPVSGDLRDCYLPGDGFCFVPNGGAAKSGYSLTLFEKERQEGESFTVQGGQKKIKDSGWTPKSYEVQKVSSNETAKDAAKSAKSFWQRLSKGERQGAIVLFAIFLFLLIR